MMSAETCNNWFLRVSYVLFAEAISRLRTSAAIVAISAIPTFTTSFVSVLRCSPGNMARNSRPANAPANTHAKAMPPIAIELRTYLQLAARRLTWEPPPSLPGDDALPSPLRSAAGTRTRPANSGAKAKKLYRTTSRPFTSSSTGSSAMAPTIGYIASFPIAAAGLEKPLLRGREQIDPGREDGMHGGRDLGMLDRLHHAVRPTCPHQSMTVTRVNPMTRRVF